MTAVSVSFFFFNAFIIISIIIRQILLLKNMLSRFSLLKSHQYVGFNLLFFFLLKMLASEISCSEYLMLLCMSFTCFDSQLKVIGVSTLFYEVSSRVFENIELYVRLCQFWILRVFFPCNPHLSDCMCAGDEGYFWEK